MEYFCLPSQHFAMYQGADEGMNQGAAPFGEFGGATGEIAGTNTTVRVAICLRPSPSPYSTVALGHYSVSVSCQCHCITATGASSVSCSMMSLLPAAT